MAWTTYLLAIFACTQLQSCFAAEKASPRPNIIVIVADDLGWNDVGFHGSGQIPTPNLDALAFSGVMLNRYYVQPICTPSRSALMTAKYPIHTGMQENVIMASQPYGLGLQETLMPQWLNRLGYSSHAVGKWHLGAYKASYTPLKRGFQSYFGYWWGKLDYYDHTNKEQFGYWGFDLRNNMEVARDQLGEYTTDLFTRKAVEVIQAHNTSKPLFLYFAHQAVHSANPYQPLQAPAKVVDRFAHIKDGDRRRFAGMLTKLDESVGLLTRALHRANMLRNSIVVFTTDNGGPAGTFDMNVASNWPLRGLKSLLWEGGVRGAGFMWSPLLKKRSYVYDGLMHITDLLPTLLAAAGGNSSALGKVDGLNMWPALQRNLGSPRKEILLNIEPSTDYKAIIEGNMKLIQGGKMNERWSGWYGPSGRNMSRYDLFSLMKDSHVGRVLQKMKMDVSREQWLQLRNQQTINCTRPAPPGRRGCSDTPCLFDLSTDPCEYRDISRELPELTAKLQQKLGTYQAGMVPPRNKPVDPRGNPKYWDYTWTNWGDLVVPPLP